MTQISSYHQPIMNTYTETIENPLNNYRIKQTLSQSKFPVYLAYNYKTCQEVVLKFYPKKNHESKSYTRELYCLKKLIHSNILELVDYADEVINIFDEDQKIISYIAISYAMHGDLLSLIKKSGSMPEKLARAVFLKLIDTLEYTHSQGIAHLDIKLENLLVDEEMEVILADFDLAQSVQDVEFEGRGTPSYRAPEVILGASNNFPAADIYSLAINLFIMLTGMPPYNENQNRVGLYDFDNFYNSFRKSPKQFWKAHKGFQNQPKIISDEFIDLFTAMLSEKPENRPTLDAIKEHAWCKKSTCDDEEYQALMYKWLAKERN